MRGDSRPAVRRGSSSEPAWHWLALGLLAAGLTGWTGCGRDTGGRLAITGHVTWRGAPLADGVIELVSVDGTRQSGASIKQGDFSVAARKGLPPGKYVVRISAVQETGAAPVGPPGPESMTQKAQDLIPPEYNTHSMLTAEVQAGARNHFEFPLK